MKTRMLIIFSSIILLISCNKNKPIEKLTQSEISFEESIDSHRENNNFTEPKNCDEFIVKYEQWMNYYLTIIENYMSNPMDEKLIQEYMKLTGEGMNWISLWNSKLGFCGSKDKYQRRFIEITERAEKKIQRMEIE